MSAGSRRSERCRRGRREPVQSCVVAQFKGVGRSVHGRVVHRLWFERCTDAQSSSVKAAAGGTTRRQATAAPAALPPSSTACCRETSWVERRAARRGMATTTSIAQANLHGRKKAYGEPGAGRGCRSARSGRLPLAVTARRGRGDRVRHAITASGNRVTTFGCTPQVSRQHACRCSLRPDRGCLTFSRRWGVLTVRHRASSRGLWLPSTSMHQARIILAVYGFEASVAQAPALRQTTAHPEPERVVTEACAWAGRFHPTDGPHRSQPAGQRGPKDKMWNPWC